MDEMVANIHVFRSGVELVVLQQHNGPLVITVNHGSPWILLTKVYSHNASLMVCT